MMKPEFEILLNFSRTNADYMAPDETGNRRNRIPMDFLEMTQKRRQRRGRYRDHGWMTLRLMTE